MVVVFKIVALSCTTLIKDNFRITKCDILSVFRKLEVVMGHSRRLELLEEKWDWYKLAKRFALPLKLSIFKEKIKIDGTRVLKAWIRPRHSIFVRELIILTSGSETTGINWNLNGMIDGWHIDHWGKVIAAITRTLSRWLNIDNGNAYHRRSEM